MNLTSGEFEQLLQLRVVTWDGDLLSKSARDTLYKNHQLINRIHGFNFLNVEGVKYLVARNYLTGNESAAEKRKWI